MHSVHADAPGLSRTGNCQTACTRVAAHRASHARREREHRTSSVRYPWHRPASLQALALMPLRLSSMPNGSGARLPCAATHPSACHASLPVLLCPTTPQSSSLLCPSTEMYPIVRAKDAPSASQSSYSRGSRPANQHAPLNSRMAGCL